MSKEAMRAAALFAASGTKRKDGKPIPPSWLLCLNWMAWYCRDSEPDYHSTISQKTLATLLQLEDVRSVRKIIAGLKALGVLAADKDGRENVYTLMLPEENPVAYGAIFAPPQHRPHRASNDEHRPHRADVQEEIQAPQYPYQVQHRPSSSYNLAAIQAPQGRDIGPVGADIGPVGAFLPIREKKGIEDEEGDARTRDPMHTQSKENEPEAETEETLLPPSPMSVMSAKDVWRLILDDLTDQKSKHELDSWYSRVSQAAWRDDGALVLRGAQSLMRFPQFRVCVEYALRRLGAEIEVEYQERDERQERKARLAK